MAGSTPAFARAAPHPPATQDPPSPVSTREGWWGRTAAGLGRSFPAEPVADRLAHHELLVVALEPGEFFGEHRHALPIGARHARDVGAPEAALRAERVDDLADVVVDVAVGVGLARIARSTRELDRHIGVFCEGQHFTEIGESSIVGPTAAATAAAMVV